MWFFLIFTGKFPIKRKLSPLTEVVYYIKNLFPGKFPFYSKFPFNHFPIIRSTLYLVYGKFIYNFNFGKFATWHFPSAVLRKHDRICVETSFFFGRPIDSFHVWILVQMLITHYSNKKKSKSIRFSLVQRYGETPKVHKSGYAKMFFFPSLLNPSCHGGRLKDASSSSSCDGGERGVVFALAICFCLVTKEGGTEREKTNLSFLHPRVGEDQCCHRLSYKFRRIFLVQSSQRQGNYKDVPGILII